MVSMGVRSDGSYGMPKGLYCSMPVITENFTYKIAKNLLLDEQAKEGIQKSVNELILEKNIIFGEKINQPE